MSNDKVKSKSEKTEKYWDAELGLSTFANNAQTSKLFALYDDIETVECLSVLSDKAQQVKNNNLSSIEDTLVSQASTLDCIFNSLAQKSSFYLEAQMMTGFDSDKPLLNKRRTHYLETTERLMRMALKAQAQCAKTLETLATIKNPTHVNFVRQANIGQNVQVNNGVAPVHAQEKKSINENPTNELLEVQHGERLDGGTAQASIGVNQNMATVEAVNGRKNSRRKG